MKNNLYETELKINTEKNFWNMCTKAPCCALYHLCASRIYLNSCKYQSYHKPKTSVTCTWACAWGSACLYAILCWSYSQLLQQSTVLTFTLTFYTMATCQKPSYSLQLFLTPNDHSATQQTRFSGSNNLRTFPESLDFYILVWQTPFPWMKH